MLTYTIYSETHAYILYTTTKSTDFNIETLLKIIESNKGNPLGPLQFPLKNVKSLNEY